MSTIVLYRSLLLSTAFPLFAGQAIAQQATSDRVIELDTITVSDTRSAQSPLDSLAGVSVVTSEELDRQMSESGADVLRRLPGVGATVSGDDASIAANIRGLQQMGRVVITLDGARQDFWRVGHGSGSFYIEPELLKQATVIRGPASNSYGSGAIGGVIAFETKDASDMLIGEETWALSQKIRYGTNGEGLGSVTTGAWKLSDKFEIIGSFGFRDTDAYKDGNGDHVRWTGERVASGFLKGVFRPAEGHEFKLGVTRQDINDIISGSSGSTSPTLSRYDTDTIVDTYTAAWNYRPSDNELVDLTVSAGRGTTRNDQFKVWPIATMGESRYYDVATSTFSAQNVSRFSIGSWDHSLTFGADVGQMKGSSDTDNFGSGTQDTRGAFAQWQGRNGPISLIASARYDTYKLEGTTKTSPDAASQEVSVSGNRLSPRVSFGYDVAEGVQLFAGYSEGYRAPHLQEMFRKNGSHGAGYEPNLLLRPEVAKSFEIGANIRRDNLFRDGDALRTKVTIFDTDVEDYIDTVATAGAATRYENIGKARLKGIELEGSYDFGAGYITLASSFTSAELASGENLGNTPLDAATARVGLRALNDKLDYGVEYQYQGAVDRVTGTIEKRHPAVDLFNVFSSYQISDSAAFDFGVQNVFDKAYTDPQTGWSTSSDIHQGRGRTLRMAFTKRFGG